MNTSITATTLNTLLNSANMTEMSIDFVQLEDRQTLTIENLGNVLVISLHLVPVSGELKNAKLLKEITIESGYKYKALVSINNMLMNYNGGLLVDKLNKEYFTEYHSNYTNHSCTQADFYKTVNSIVEEQKVEDCFCSDMFNEYVQELRTGEIDGMLGNKFYSLPA